MRNSEYFHYLFWDFENEAEHQHQIEIDSDFKDREKVYLCKELKDKFYSLVYLTPQPSELQDFLDKQYEEYKYIKTDFIAFLTRCLDVRLSVNLKNQIEQTDLQKRKEYIQKWINEKNNEIGSLNQYPYRRKTLYFFDYLYFNCAVKSDKEDEKNQNYIYQLFCTPRNNNKCNEIYSISCHNELNLILEHRYYENLFKWLTPQQCWDFLDFHLKMYCEKASGQEINFLYFIKDTLTQTRYSQEKNIRLLSGDPTRISLVNEWIERKKTEFQLTPQILNQAHQQIGKPKQDNPLLTIRQIALKSFYEGNYLSRKNCEEIAKEYGYKASGKLYQLYTFYSYHSNRTKPEDSIKKNQNKLTLFETVIKLLETNQKAKQLAIVDMNNLKATIEKDNT